MTLERLRASLADRYRLERQLGQGGMATVYLAQDLKHDRQVAIKVLRPELAAVLGAERFVAEIKTTAALQHPHILPLFDSGQADGFLYYVMPYIEGETLRDKLSRETQLGIDEAVRITREVADALDYAHRHGVIHRDIKPENILLHDGRPMVADFGIALAVSAAAGGRMTETGMSLGTPHYMSPEQATADKAITARSDIYSLASVLYEMLAGEPPHTGSSAQAIIMKIVAEPAQAVTRLRKSVPPNVAAALAKALEKVPADRFETATEFAAALSNPGFAAAAGGEGAPAPARRLRSRTAGYGIAAGFVALTALAAWGWLRPRPEPVSRFVISFPAEAAPVLTTMGTHLAVSPDGSMLVYVGGTSGEGVLWLKRRDALPAEAITGTEGAYDPFFSPDGRQVGFFTDHGGRAMKVVSLAGGPPRAVVSQVGQSGAYWAADGYIYFDANVEGLQRVKPDGTALETVVPLDSTQQETGVAWPHVLPDGKVVIFRLRHAGDAPGDFTIVAARIGTTHRHVVTRAVTALFASGRLLFVTADGTLQAATFDERHLALAGPPVGVADGLRMYGTYAGVDLAVTGDGDLYYVSGGAGEASTLEWVTRGGVRQPVDTSWRASGEIRGVALAPDGQEAAIELVGSGTAGTHVWIKHLPAGPLTRLTVESERAFGPSWSGDGRHVVFLSERVKPLGVFRRSADGAGNAVLIAQADRDLSEASESPDGRWLVARTANGQAGAGDILAMELGRDTALRPLLATPAPETNPAFSPDGHWLAYVSSASGRREVYVRPFPDVNRGVWQVSTEGGMEPRWSHGGKEIFFRGIGGAEMMVVDVQTAPTFHAGPTRLLFRSDAVAGEEYVRYDVTSDDRRFLVVRPSGVETAAQLVRVEHFLRALERGTSP
jgi:eukaryotic-like serine/threonine-protein kinase